MSTDCIQHVVVLGGGAAGWLSAGLIAAGIRKSNRECRVTLVESPRIPIVGVGEGTWPTMRKTLMTLGIEEADFIRECDATFKQGARFQQWRSDDEKDFYYHPLMLPNGFDSVDIGAAWLQSDDDQRFSEALCIQETLCELGLAPKHMATPAYAAVANYAYHLDAGKFTRFLCQHITNQLGVGHVLQDVVGIESRACGDIAALVCDNGQRLTGDLFVDCSGFQSQLLHKHYQIPFVDRDDVLFADRALAVHQPYAHADAPIACHTLSTAQTAGWIWDIGLQSRRGVGYVYSSRHQSADEAHRVLQQYCGGNIECKEIAIRCGHRQKFWHRNCVAIGLSAGFLEPLEASALVLVELSASMVAEQLPNDRKAMDIVARRFNERFRYRWDRIIDFLKLHYCLSERRDTAFWRDNVDPASMPDSLKELLVLWQHRAPGNADFDSISEVFPAASYQYVLYGMQRRTATKAMPDLMAAYHHQRRLCEEQLTRARRVLPDHRHLINQICSLTLAA